VFGAKAVSGLPNGSLMVFNRCSFAKMLLKQTWKFYYKKELTFTFMVRLVFNLVMIYQLFLFRWILVSALGKQLGTPLFLVLKSPTTHKSFLNHQVHEGVPVVDRVTEV
jgi:hypothetical protein